MIQTVEFGCPGLHSNPRVSSEIEAYLQQANRNAAYAAGLARSEEANGGVPPTAIAAHRLVCREFLAGLDSSR